MKSIGSLYPTEAIYFKFEMVVIALVSYQALIFDTEKAIFFQRRISQC